jgi:predicted nucleotide-binding protein (sugar kinase/HSP70/actin superfamily)
VDDSDVKVTATGQIAMLYSLAVSLMMLKIESSIANSIVKDVSKFIIYNLDSSSDQVAMQDEGIDLL